VLSAQGPLFGAALATWGDAVIRTWVYVDGFNLYYGAVKGTPYKWLDVLALAKHLLAATHTVDKIKYFTARVSGAADPDAPRRQHAYLSALATLPQVELHFGRFLSKTIWRPITNFPVAGATIHSPITVSLPTGNHQVTGGSLSAAAAIPVNVYPPKGVKRAKKTPRPLPDALIAEVHTMEEKGSDVNLAAHLLNDAWKGAFQAAMVISNDTDLVTPIQMVSVERGKPVFVVCPGRWQMAPALERVASHKRHIHRSMLQASQFPDPIPGTTISKPTSW
jgi:hypothetical protein